jgi:serine/threonine-protein kinase RIO1
LDSVAAKYLAAELLGKKVGGWEVGELIDHGKSAAVFHASDDGRAGVIKVFDREIVERYGDKAQQGRI